MIIQQIHTTEYTKGHKGYFFVSLCAFFAPFVLWIYFSAVGLIPNLRLKAVEK